VGGPTVVFGWQDLLNRSSDKEPARNILPFSLASALIASATAELLASIIASTPWAPNYSRAVARPKSGLLL